MAELRRNLTLFDMTMIADALPSPWLIMAVWVVGGLTGFLFGWAYFLVVNAGGLGALSVAFATDFGFFVAMSAWFVAVTLVERPAQAWAGLAFLALGVPVYFYWKGRKQAAAAAQMR